MSGDLKNRIFHEFSYHRFGVTQPLWLAFLLRTFRKTFAELSRRIAVTPICWNQIGRFYQRLGPIERELLMRPFDVHSRLATRSEIRGQNPIAELRRFRFCPSPEGEGEALRQQRCDPRCEIRDVRSGWRQR